MLKIEYVGPLNKSVKVKKTEHHPYFVHMRHENISNSGRVANTDFILPNADEIAYVD